ncbi:MAG: BamA/TamA family outer membrane protein [Bacteroidales bacterium]|nr:BamA/TamA family outer membrane protein [Bacteroidales bacterium]
MVSRYKINANNSQGISNENLESYVIQKPNRRFINLFRFRLGVYNIFNNGKTKFAKWMTENIGEAPVIYDEYYSTKSVENMEQYLNNKGYYNATVRFEPKLKKQQVSLKYYIETGKPYRIRSVYYQTNDSILQIISNGLKRTSIIKPGQLFDLDIIKAERNRITKAMRNIGYFKFSNDYVNFKADTANNMLKADLTITINDFIIRNEKGAIIETEPHRKYYVDSTFIYYNFDPQKALKFKEQYYQSFDTLKIGEKIYILFNEKLNINPKVILRSYYIRNNAFYRIDNEIKTKQQLSLNKLFKIVTINFKEQEKVDSLPHNKLNCTIQITPFTQQSFTVEIEGSNNEGDWGSEINFRYKNKNIFKGADILSFKLKAGFQTDGRLNSDTIFYSQEYGAEMQIEIPKFLFPFQSINFDKKFRPKTLINTGYNYEKSRDYTKPALFVNYGYFWMPSAYTYHRINLLDITGIRYYKPSQRFNDFKAINDYYKYSFEDYYVYALNYTYNYSNQNKKKYGDFQFLKLFLESSGNSINLFYDIINKEKVDGVYQTFNVPFSQYVKFDFDLRLYNKRPNNTTTIYRLFMGIGYPYGNSEALPSIKKYFAGGANSMRAWSTKQLGPGSFFDSEEGAFHYYLGDIKLEANFEYRFPFIWLIDGAFFFDIGNIWTLKDVGLTGSNFKFNKFYKDLAMGVGAGLRFDFSFLVLRTDLGLKLKDPTYINDNGTHWIIGSRSLKGADFNLNIGIGYPF